MGGVLGKALEVAHLWLVERGLDQATDNTDANGGIQAGEGAGQGADDDVQRVGKADDAAVKIALTATQ